MRTDTIAISRILLFSIASASACDFGKGYDTDGANDDASSATSWGESSGGGAYDDDDGAGVTTNATTATATATSTSGGSGCDPSATGHVTQTTGPDDAGWGTSGAESGILEDGGVPTTGFDGGESDGWGSATTAGETEGPSCDLPLAPGNFVYGCECEDPTCDIWYDGVAQIPGFDQYCDCLCETKGCGGAVGGVGEAGGEEG